LVPAYNAAPWVEEAVSSLLGQTYSELEVIVVNDCSKDETLEKVSAIRDSRLKIFSNSENRGLIGTLNHACAVATGDYFARMDADDVAHPERIEKQMKALLADEKLSVVGTAIRFFTKEENWGDVTTAPLVHPTQAADMRANLPFYSSLGHGASLFRRRVFEANVGRDPWGQVAVYDPAFPHAEDYELWSRLALAGHKMRSLPEVLQEVRLHRSSVSQRENTTQLQIADRVRARWRRALGLSETGAHADTQSALGRMSIPKDPAFLDRVEACFEELFSANQKTRLFDASAWEKALSARWWQAGHSLTLEYPRLRWRVSSSRWARATDPFGLRAANLVLKTLIR
jgi:glycosyltransferase involved in cell wall biosynthesis